MRKKQTFLLTVLTPETDDASFCGKLKDIASGKTCTFTNLDEFYQAISAEINPGEDNPLQPHEILRQPDHKAPVSNSLGASSCH